MLYTVKLYRNLTDFVFFCVCGVQEHRANSSVFIEHKIKQLECTLPFKKMSLSKSEVA